MNDIRKYLKLDFIVSGCAWIGAAIFSAFHGVFASVLTLLFSLIAFVILLFRIRWRRNVSDSEFDEMAEL